MVVQILQFVSNLADSRAQLGVPNYQKPDLKDNVCRQAKHPPAQSLTVHPVQGCLNGQDKINPGLCMTFNFLNLVQTAGKNRSPAPNLLISCECRQKSLIGVKYNLYTYFQFLTAFG
jgi:hypothetical protein